MNPHTMFLRTECVLPDGLDLIQERFCGTWMSVKDTMAAALDVKVRNAGWHFMWLEDAYARFGVGRTATSAIDKAIASALDRIKDRFNAAELENGQISVNEIAGRELLQRLRAELSAGQRQTLELHFFEGYSFQEIAEKTGQTIGNIRNHYYRGREPASLPCLSRKTRLK